MHPEADAFLDAIFDTPDDDTPRLVYADWLAEHGQEHYAQFIRLQCAAARYPLWSAEANRLWEEIGRVWQRLDEEWWPATRDAWYHPVRTLDAIHFHRGFLRSSIPFTAAALVRYANSCWPWLPYPTTLLSIDGDDSELLALERLTRIRRLRLKEWDDYDIRYLLHCPRLRGLEALDLTDGLVAADDVEELLAPDFGPRLREVRLRMFDQGRYHACVSGVPEGERGPPSLALQELRRRTEARFEKVVWLWSH